MKIRGLKIEAIAAAEAKYKREKDAEPVCRAIESAFSGVRLGNGIGLKQAQGIDDYEDPGTCNAYRATDEKDDWRRIDSEALNQCHSSLSFFDAEGMRFHLPAYLIAELKGDYDFGLAFCLTHLSDYSRGQFVLLSSNQRAAVRAFLLHMATDPNYELGWPHLDQALKEYWTQET